MTMTPTRTETHWINIDALTSEKMRLEARDLEAELRSLLTQASGIRSRIVGLAQETQAAYEHAKAQIEPMLDNTDPTFDLDDGSIDEGVWQLVQTISGKRRVMKVVYELFELLDPDKIENDGGPYKEQESRD